MTNSYINLRHLFVGRHVVIYTTTASVLVILNFAAGLLASAINVPGASGLITGFTVPFFLVILNRTTKSFGSMTMCWIIYSTISIPLYLMGPPNIFKPIFGFIIALAFELPILIFKQKKFSYYLGLFTYTAAIIGMAYVAFAFLNLPGSKNAYKYMLPIALIFSIEGCISVFVAHKVYENNVLGSHIERFFHMR